MLLVTTDGRKAALDLRLYDSSLPDYPNSKLNQAVAEMLPAYWALGQRLPAAKKALLEGSDIREAELATAVGRLQQGAPAATVLDERYSAAFTMAGTAEDCRAQAAAYAAAGVTELALTFAGANAAADMATVAKAMSE